MQVVLDLQKELEQLRLDAIPFRSQFFVHYAHVDQSLAPRATHVSSSVVKQHVCRYATTSVKYVTGVSLKSGTAIVAVPLE